MENLRLQLKNEAQDYLNNINKDNFWKSYDGFIAIIIKYKEKGVKKEDVMQVIEEIDSMDLDKYKEDVIIEISKRVEGFSSSSLAIKWDDE